MINLVFVVRLHKNIFFRNGNQEARSQIINQRTYVRCCPIRHRESE